MSEMPNRIPDEKGWRRIGGTYVCGACDRVAVEQKFNRDWSTENAEFTPSVIVLVRSVNYVQLYCCSISKFIDILKLPFIT